jgi:nuclear GTP-binding protein
LTKKEKEEQEQVQAENGSEKLMTILFKYAKKFAEKKGTDFIGVGVLGMPNVGKSALINMLKNKAVCATNSIPFTTRGI